MRLLISLSILFSFASFSQEFPEDWIGNYSGTMIIGSLERQNDTVLVQFDIDEIDKDSSWSYLMTFKSQKYGDIIKDYVIRKSGSGNPKSFILDEQDGIIIEMSFLNNSFYSVFELNETIYVSTLSRTSEGIYFDLFVTPRANSLKTSPIPEESISDDESNRIEVSSYKTTMHQTVLLKRIQ